MTDKFRVKVVEGQFANEWPRWPRYFERFWEDCKTKAKEGGWTPLQVANYELKPWGGRVIATNTQGWYLRWDNESSHTLFVLRWT